MKKTRSKKSKTKIALVAFGSVVLMLAGSTFLGTPSFAGEDVADLKAQVKQLQERIDQLEKQNAATTAKPQQIPQMQAVVWDPFAELMEMQRTMDQMFQNSFARGKGSPLGSFSNRLLYDNDFNIKEKKDGYEITFDLTGLDKDNVNIEINDSAITVSGQYSNEQSDEGLNGYFKSQSFGSILKTIPLPEDADTSQVVTNKVDDALIIEIPKDKS